MKLRLNKSIVGVAYVAALTFSANAFSQVNSDSNVKLLLEMQSLRQEIADLRNTVEVQGYMIDQLKKTEKIDNTSDVINNSSLLNNQQTVNTAINNNGYSSQASGVQGASQSKPASQPVTVQRTPAVDFPVQAEAKPVEVVSIPVNPALGEISAIKVEDRASSAQSSSPVSVSPAPQSRQSRLLEEGDNAIKTSLSEDDLYNKGIAKLQAKEYKTAASIFSAQLQNHPKGQKAADGYYWLAETFYILNDYESAAKSYESLFTLFPKHSRAPKALLKLIKLHKEQGDNTSAKSAFGKLTNLYSNSKSAADAKALYKEFL